MIIKSQNKSEKPDLKYFSDNREFLPTLSKEISRKIVSIRKYDKSISTKKVKDEKKMKFIACTVSLMLVFGTYYMTNVSRIESTILVIRSMEKNISYGIEKTSKNILMTLSAINKNNQESLKSSLASVGSSNISVIHDYINLRLKVPAVYVYESINYLINAVRVYYSDL